MIRLIKISFFTLITILFIITAMTESLYSARIKDIATIEGNSTIQVIGYGLVTGLTNTGDNQMSSFAVQSVSNMLKRFGLTTPQTNPRIRNVAAVMVTASIPASTKKGSKIDVQISSIGDATSLQGGVLLLSPISTADGTIIGMAQGALSVGGYDVGAYGSRVMKNVTTTGRVPSGLLIESEFSSQYMNNKQIRINLREPDFTTASRISSAINKLAGLDSSAIALDATTIQVKMPATQNQDQLIQTISQIETLNIISDPSAKIVINERTGTVVVGGNVQLLPAVIAHGGLEISIQKQVILPYPPPPFTINYRATKPVEVATIQAQEQTNPAIALKMEKPTVEDIATALNALKVSPRDLISIFQALKESGALQGELIIQ
jgi:flagellar P-ring protein precursor FlgI